MSPKARKKPPKEPDTRSEEEKRSYTMSRVKSRDTSIEIKFRKELYRAGVRYRVDYKKAPGKPDVAITKWKIAVFCDGEFWHGYDWGKMRERIKSRREYWIPKIERTMARDKAAEESLKAAGWLVFRFWGKEIERDLPGCVGKVLAAVSERAGKGAGYGEAQCAVAKAAEGESAYGAGSLPAGDDGDSPNDLA